jgi:asparagine synthase (glutamine-hydrolysing)
LRLRCNQAYDFVPNANERALLGAMLGDLSNFLAPLLRRLDRMSMAASVECRVPFLDHRLGAAALKLPLSYRLKGSTDKWLLKTIATRYVPRQIVYRKKMGFPLPLDIYLAPLAQPALFQDGFCVNVLGLSPRGIQDLLATWRSHIPSFYNLLVLEMWGRLHIYRESVEDMTQRVVEL